MLYFYQREANTKQGDDKMIKIYQKIIEGMSQEATLYWLNVGVKVGDISEAQAGYILYNGIYLI
jgi:hypothetical protein